MKISVLIGAILAVTVVILYLLFSHGDSAGPKTQSGISKSSAAAEDVLVDEPGQQQDFVVQPMDSSDETRRHEMQAAFSDLQQSRRQLKSRVNLLKSKIWGLKLPAEQATKINKQMRQTYAYLKNPPMLGAYFDLNEILHELRKVAAMQKDLQQAEHLVTRSQNAKD